MIFSKLNSYFSYYLAILLIISSLFYWWHLARVGRNNFKRLSYRGTVKKQGEKRVKILREFLLEQNSPLASSADEFIEVADKYNLPWTLLPAIAGKESSFGRYVPYVNGRLSYNPFGWGVSGNRVIMFDSWAEAINVVGQRLSTIYYQRGINNPTRLERYYNPISYSKTHSWRRGVIYFISLLEKRYSSAQALSCRISYDAVLDPQTADMIAKVD